MRKLRCAMAGIVALLVVLGFAPAAEANSGPARLQRLAAKQTQLLFRFFHGAPQAISPQRCNAGQNDLGYHGVFLLPTNSFGSGNQKVHCVIDTHSVLVDLGGGVVSEDARGDTYTLSNGTVLTYTRKNLQPICDDAARYFTGVPATVDGHPISGTAVVSRNFSIKVNSDAEADGLPFYQDSIDLGHPGRLAACYTGTKALVHLSRGRHVISVDLSGYWNEPTTFTYVIKVNC